MGLQHEKKEMPKTAKPSKPSADGEETDDISTDRPSSDTPMPTKGYPSKLLQHENREMPSISGKEDNNKSPSSITQKTPDQSLSKPGTREEPSNQEKSSDKPNSDIQVPKKGVPSKLLQHEKKEMPRTAKSSKPSADGEETNNIPTDEPSGEIPMPTKGVPSKLLQHEKRETPSEPGKEVTGKTPSSMTQNTPDQSLPKTGSREQLSNQEKSSDSPHSDIQMPKKGVPSKLLQHEKKEKPKTAKPSKPSADGEETDDFSTDRPSIENQMPTKGLPSKLLQHEKRELPSKPGKEDINKSPLSTSENTPDQSIPKANNRERPSNQEKSTDKPHSDIQMPKKGVPSKLLPYEKKEIPKTAKHPTPSSDGEETDDISTDRPSFEIPMPTKG